MMTNFNVIKLTELTDVKNPKYLKYISKKLLTEKFTEWDRFQETMLGRALGNGNLFWSSRLLPSTVNVCVKFQFQCQ